MDKENNKKKESKKKSEDNSNNEHTINIVIPKKYDIISNEILNDTNNGNINILDITRIVWSSKGLIIKYVMIASIIGIIYALISPKEYRSTATLMPEYQSESVSSASSLINQYGSLLGISSGTYSSDRNAISIALYPNIVQSSSYQLKLIHTHYYFSDVDTTATLYEYYTELRSKEILSQIKGFTIGLPQKMINKIISITQKNDINTTNKMSSNIDNDNILHVTKKEAEIIELLREKVSASLDMETGIISVSVLMPDAHGAANVATHASMQPRVPRARICPGMSFGRTYALSPPTCDFHLRADAQTRPRPHPTPTPHRLVPHRRTRTGWRVPRQASSSCLMTSSRWWPLGRRASAWTCRRCRSRRPSRASTSSATAATRSPRRVPPRRRC